MSQYLHSSHRISRGSSAVQAISIMPSTSSLSSWQYICDLAWYEHMNSPGQMAQAILQSQFSIS